MKLIKFFNICNLHAPVYTKAMKVKILHILCSIFTLTIFVWIFLGQVTQAKENIHTNDTLVLLNNYIENYKKRFNSTYRMYRNDISPQALTINKKLNGIQKSLLNTESSNLQPIQKQKIIKNQIRILETVYKEAKEYLEYEQWIYIKDIQKKHNQYSSLSKKITLQLDRFIQTLSASLRKKNSLSSRDKKVVTLLVNIRNENEQLKLFPQKSFETQRQMQEYIKQRVYNIRLEFQKLKNLY